ncbi:hypothetical protein FS837_001509 [Tulasnella sp. UAMH 9824]|nr:hypothetical protein FS837_001509 [Tulasnella sp. UAMH 9824]
MFLSVATGAASPSPGLTTLTFYPGFGAFNDELYEEYLKNTVLSGLAATGGLYTTFDFLFVLLFGRSLLAALFRSKHITPFGAVASMLRRDKFCKTLLDKYPGIEDEDPSKRAQATCNLLHDLLLDLTPLEIKPTSKKNNSDDGPEEVKVEGDATGGGENIELARVTTGDRFNGRSYAAGGSGRT